MKKIAFILLSTLSMNSLADKFNPPSSFSAAKRALYYKIYKNHGETFYTGCNWHKKRVDLYSCDLENAFPKKYRKRAKRIEAEHIIPASWMYKKHGKWRKCVIEAKKRHKNIRSYCQKVDINYRNAHNDLVNLLPAVGAINAWRSNKPFSSTPRGEGKKVFKGKRTVVIDSRVIVPDKSIRGDIARIALYMQEFHGVSYSKRQEELFWKWDMDDPVSAEELALCKKIRRIQGRCALDYYSKSALNAKLDNSF